MLLDSAGLAWPSLPAPAFQESSLSSETLLVRFAAGAEPGSAQAMSANCYSFQPTMQSGLWQIQVPQLMQSSILAALRHDPAVTFVEPLQFVSIAAVPNYFSPNDPSLNSLYAM